MALRNAGISAFLLVLREMEDFYLIDTCLVFYFCETLHSDLSKLWNWAKYESALWNSAKYLSQLWNIWRWKSVCNSFKWTRKVLAHIFRPPLELWTTIVHKEFYLNEKLYLNNRPQITIFFLKQTFVFFSMKRYMSLGISPRLL